MPNNNRETDIRCVNSHLEMFQNEESATEVDYSFEEERIKSFVSWPVHFPVDPIRLAKAGFFYSGNGDEVICFSCNGHIKDWNYGDIVQKKHSNLFPNCDFVNDRSKNVPITVPKNKRQIYSELKQKKAIVEPSTALSEVIKTINYNEMKSPSKRLKSFDKKWPHSSIDVLKLAQAGFFYLGCQDKVQCPFCKGIVSNWEVEDDPAVEHRKHFPWCDYISKDVKNKSFEKCSWFQFNSDDLCGNMQKNTTEKYKLLDEAQEHMNLKELGVHPYTSPAHPQQASPSARLRSFATWPTTSPVHKEDLVKAGFFYIGIGDHTKCFHCNGGLCNWESGDDPWVEHARWFCNCNFLRLNKGDKFVEDCLKKCIPENIKESDPGHSFSYFSSEPLMVKVDEAMKTNMIKYILDSGLFPHYIVRVAVLRQIEETGSTFSDMNELCLAVTYLKEEMEKMPLENSNAAGLSTCNINMRKCVIDESKRERTVNNPSVGEMENSSSPSVSSGNSLLLTNNEKDKLENKTVENKSKSSGDQCWCKICMDKEVGVAFLPCGHLLACTECAAAMELCPTCRKPIQATVRIYVQ